MPPGSPVAVRPDDYVTAPVEGTLMQRDADDVAVLRDDPLLGQVMMHFPRVGYTVKALPSAGR